LEDLGVDDRITLELILETQGEKLWTGFIWLNMGMCVGLLWTRKQTFWF